MSEVKLANYLSKSNFNPPIGPRQFTPVILSDSKGKYLKDNIVNSFDNNIVWWCRSGANIEDSFKWLKANIDNKLKTLVKIRLYIWLGTCNLTSKDKGIHISLRSTNDDTVNHIIEQLHTFQTFLAGYPQVQYTFLEIPVYSIIHWNKSHNHPDTTIFKEQQTLLENQVQKVNDEIRKLNCEIGTNSPDFSKFLKASTRHRTRSKYTTWKYFNFNLYRDGIHPGQSLARVWLREIGDRIKTQCW